MEKVNGFHAMFCFVDFAGMASPRDRVDNRLATRDERKEGVNLCLVYTRHIYLR